ncbi:MAG: dienelactone hydrolase family protein [Ignavibacteriae bacterium]|nr:dienelactone hydrolase family protein [Ignavibacteriota bacterium]MCB9243128.1 dienelactone hydrolase family protein [Ignavibacteriales bacterium]
MKKLIIFVIMLVTTQVFAQNKTCCDIEATEKFSKLGNEAGFKEKHPDPITFIYKDMKGKMITYDTDDGKTANAYYIESPNPSNKWLMVFHEWYGLNDYIKQESDLLQGSLGDVNVIALDLYDGNVATNSDEASKYMQNLDQLRAIDIIEGAIKYAGENAQFGTIGWCFGGGWSLNATLIAGKQADACVMYYGMPSDDIEKLKTLNCPVLGIFAEQDGHITVEIVEKFKENMKAADKELTVYMYDAAHAFANPSNPKYNAEAREDAMSKTIAFLKENLMK